MIEIVMEVKFRCIKPAAQEEQIQVVPGEAGKNL